MKRGKPSAPESMAQAYPRLIHRTGRLEVWLVQGGSMIERIGFVGMPLALDALRHGEDVIAHLFDEARRTLERRQPARRLTGRLPRTTRGVA